MIEFPLFIFETHVLIFDDDPDFSEIVRGVLTNRFLESLVCHDYSSFIKIIEEKGRYKTEPFFNHVEEVNYEEHYLSFSLKNLNNLIKKELEKGLISVLVIDHHMPEKNGLDILEDIKDLNLKKILLTGAVNDEEAIDAFNKRKIQAFIPKQSLVLYEDLLNYATKLHYDFFLDISKALLTSTLLEAIPNCVFKSKDFKNLFMSLMDENHIVSYKTLSLGGIFRLNSKVGKSYILANISQDDFEAFIENGKENDIPEYLIAEVMGKKSVPFALKEDKPFLSFQEWQESMKPLQSIIIENSTFHIVFFEEVL